MKPMLSQAWSASSLYGAMHMLGDRVEQCIREPPQHQDVQNELEDPSLNQLFSLSC